MNLTNINWAIFIAIALVVAVLVAGVINLAFSGDKAKSRSNQLMRLRVIVQFVAVVLIMVGFWFKTRN
ncbi:MAG: twin transmembrane helix small protein [Caulobacterales bacterium]|nr:twin transmembrane helix small protein [Caulobacterales bacterium]MCA0371702.1 twin transmembrane helix small protein [Pseudomonadota bacterium]